MEKELYLAGGCFWGLEQYVGNIPGVEQTEVGYANGKTANPTYEEVCYSQTGHAETVKVIYDSQKLRLEFLLQLFFEVIDPTSLNRQGNDVGEQYRTGIYYVDSEDKQIIEQEIRRLQENYAQPIQIEIQPLNNYYSAEEYHQKYLDKNPLGYCHISPKKIHEVKERREE